MEQFLVRVTEKHDQLAKALPLPTESLRSLRDDFLIRYAHETTALEGNTLSLHETQVVLENGITIGGKLLREHLEVVNARDAMVWLEGFVATSEPISEHTILRLHEIIMQGILGSNTGTYRRQAVRIVGSVHIPPNWINVPNSMEGFIKWVEKGTGGDHPIAFAAKAHVSLVGIHPFVDGNGRVSRMLVNLLLMRDGYPPALYSSADRAQYLDSLERAHTEGHMDDFVALTAEAVETTLDEYLEILAMTLEGEETSGKGSKRGLR